MINLLKEYKDNFSFLINGVLFSLSLIFATAKLKIINPTFTDWLEAGDGIAEISWEFFRRQPVMQFPLGLNPKYGLEISSTMAFDGQIPIMSLIFHPIASQLPERFQYYGIFIFISFTLNYFFASKIFSILRMSSIQIIFNSLALSLSPVILNRYIENTHYALTAAWLIFWAIYLCFNENVKFYSWIVLFNLTVFIHFYYILFVTVIFIVQKIYHLIQKKIKLTLFLIQNAIIFFTVIFSMYVIGYFYGNVSSEDLGYGLFRSTLTSIIDPSGWSFILPDLPELDGTYEGFSFLGLTSLIMIIISILIRFQYKFRKEIESKINFTPIWIAAIILFSYSLSNKIAIGTLELFQFPIPWFFEKFANTLRSTGRYTWLLVFILFIWISYNLFLKLNTKIYNLILIFALTTSFFDSSKQLISQRTEKFSSTYETNLTNPAWYELNNCYKNIRVYPPVAGVDNVYNFLVLANDLRMGINTGRLGRFSQTAVNTAYADMQERFRNGNYLKDSFYIFSKSQFISNEVIEFHENFALRTINEKSGWGIIDGFTFIAPDIMDCSGGKNIIKNTTSIGPSDNILYKGEELKFGFGESSDKYALTGVLMQNEGIIPQDDSFSIFIVTQKNFSANKILINARTNSKDFENLEFNVNLNNSPIGTCKFNTDITTCEIFLNESHFGKPILNFSIKLTNLKDNTKIQNLLISSFKLI